MAPRPFTRAFVHQWYIFHIYWCIPQSPHSTVHLVLLHTQPRSPFNARISENLSVPNKERIDDACCKTCFLLGYGYNLLIIKT